eukprot:scaffold11309_cov38-Prasinocladus_malaysianus.AAC.1
MASHESLNRAQYGIFSIALEVSSVTVEICRGRSRLQRFSTFREDKNIFRNLCRHESSRMKNVF